MSGMRMEFGQRQVQTMTLAPRMIQSMEILQMPLMALQERIEEELQENPVLELRNGTTKTDEVAPETEFNADAPMKHDENGDAEFNRLDELNKDWGDHFNEEHRPSRSMSAELGDRKHDAMQNIETAPCSLQQHLNEQLSYQDLSQDERELTEFVISNLDDNGYLLAHDPEKKAPRPIQLDELARNYEAMSGKAVTLAQVEDALFTVQDLDPAGVGARDSKECLLLQVDDEFDHPELLRTLIQNHLEDVAYNRLPVIQKKTGCDLDVLEETIDELKRLDPKPGSKYTPTNTQYVVPDVIVERNDAGDFDIKLSEDWEPSIRIPKNFYLMAKDKANDPKTREFLKRKIQSAEWLLDAIQQRRNTLIKVTREIIEHQRDFLDKGPDFIQPLKMEQIALKVGVHVTTVSRAVDDKWVQTPRGIFALKRFFGGGTRNEQTGVDVAWESIRQKLLEFIAAEDKSSPLSDEDIVKQFDAAGFKVARRTVTKYREALNIPSSRQRKDWAK
ncbi:RNA polymerase factor sigma-54 [soil metagenome]